MNKQRQTYQQGCIQRKKRERSPDVWILRYRENGMLKAHTIGTVLQFRTKAEAQRSLARCGPISTIVLRWSRWASCAIVTSKKDCPNGTRRHRRCVR